MRPPFSFGWSTDCSSVYAFDGSPKTVIAYWLALWAMDARRPPWLARIDAVECPAAIVREPSVTAPAVTKP